jgi:hypothetical protein
MFFFDKKVTIISGFVLNVSTNFTSFFFFLIYLIIGGFTKNGELLYFYSTKKVTIKFDHMSYNVLIL